MTTTGLRARSAAALGSSATLAAFRVRGYPTLWLSGAASGLGWSATMVAIGWIALATTDSVFAVGAILAVRLVPSLILGIPLGGLVDRHDRRTTLILVNLVATLPLLWVAFVAGTGALAVAQLVAFSLALGVVDTLRGAAMSTYTFDLVGPGGASNAIALGNLGAFTAGAVGSILGGLTIERIGVASPFLLSAAMLAVAAVLLVVRPAPARRERPASHLAPSFRRSMTLILRNRRVALIALILVMAEVLGFSSTTVYPTFVRDVLHSNATGLGALATARQLGAILGLLVLARAGLRASREGGLIVLVTFGFGVSLMAFALSTSFAISFAVCVLVGMAMAGIDTLSQTLIQRNVEDSERGSAMGIWFFAIGFGPFGLVGLGAAAAVIGAPAALAISGALLTLFALSLTRVRAINELV